MVEANIIQQKTEAVYKTVSQDVSNTLTKNPEYSSLIIIGETHNNPASAIVELSALEAVRRKVGSESMVLAIELPQEYLDRTIKNIQSNPDFLNQKPENGFLKGETWGNAAHLHAVKYALDHNIRMIGIDPNAVFVDINNLGSSLPEENHGRETAMINELIIGADPKYHGGKEPFVVAIVGSAHLSGLMQTPEAATNQEIKNRPASDLEKYFGHVSYYNATGENTSKKIDPAISESLTVWTASEQKFLTNPETPIVQFNLPNKKDVDPFAIRSNVENAAEKLEPEHKTSKKSSFVPADVDNSLIKIRSELQASGVRITEPETSAFVQGTKSTQQSSLSIR